MDFVDELEKKKRISTLQLLMRCARLANEYSLSRLPETDGVRPRAAHTALFPHIDHEGTRLSELARRVGISKQAVGQLVDDLEAMGAVERVPDPDDGRAKRVAFTEQGRRGLMEGLSHLLRIEDELGQGMEPDAMDRLRTLLLELQERLQEVTGDP